MSKQKILKKLGLTERGATIILSNKDLCERILNETPIHSLEFADKNGLDRGFVYRIIKKNIISSFTNNPRQGSKVYVFEEEALEIIGKSIECSSIYRVVDNSIKILIPFLEKIYKGAEYKILYDILINKKTRQQVADEFGLTKERIIQIYGKAYRRTKRYVTYMKDAEELTKKVSDLSIQSENLKMLINKHQTEFNVSDEDVKKLSILNTKLFDYDLSVRALTVLKCADIYTVGDLVRFDIKDLLKFRNMGKKTMRELEELIKGLGLEYGLKDLPNYSKINHFVQFLYEHEVDIPEELVTKFQLTYKDN